MRTCWTFRRARIEKKVPGWSDRRNVLHKQTYIVKQRNVLDQSLVAKMVTGGSSDHAYEVS